MTLIFLFFFLSFIGILYVYYYYKKQVLSAYYTYRLGYNPSNTQLGSLCRFQAIKQNTQCLFAPKAQVIISFVISIH